MGRFRSLWRAAIEADPGNVPEEYRDVRKLKILVLNYDWDEKVLALFEVETAGWRGAGLSMRYEGGRWRFDILWLAEWLRRRRRRRARGSLPPLVEIELRNERT